MNEREPIDRRLADHEFKESIREQLAIIRTTQRTHDLSLDRIEKRQEESQAKIDERLESLEDLIKGGLGSAGFDERLRDVEKSAAKHDAILEGSHGLRKVVEGLAEGNETRTEWRKQDLAFWGLVVVALISNMDRFGRFFKVIWENINTPLPLMVEPQPPKITGIELPHGLKRKT